MQTYRLYFLGANGHFAHAIAFECDSDEEAIETVKAHVDGRPMELWQQARKVMDFPASARLGDQVSSHP